MKQPEPTYEQKKKFVLKLMAVMLVNFALMACAWVKANQHQTDSALWCFVIFLIFNVLAKAHILKI
jgi:hypothetical protein